MNRWKSGQRRKAILISLLLPQRLRARFSRLSSDASEQMSVCVLASKQPLALNFFAHNFGFATRSVSVAITVVAAAVASVLLLLLVRGLLRPGNTFSPAFDPVS